MTIREATIAKLQQIPESLLQEISDFIDFVEQKHQSQTVDKNLQKNTAETWAKWFESVDKLETRSTKSVSEYQKLLLDKYRQQGLDL